MNHGWVNGWVHACYHGPVNTFLTLCQADCWKLNCKSQPIAILVKLCPLRFWILIFLNFLLANTDVIVEKFFIQWQCYWLHRPFFNRFSFGFWSEMTGLEKPWKFLEKFRHWFRLIKSSWKYTGNFIPDSGFWFCTENNCFKKVMNQAKSRHPQHPND